MLAASNSAWAAWAIAAAAIAAIVIRPFRLPEAVWAVTGASALVAFGLLSPGDALAGVRKGTDVYLFLAGMMLIAELARQTGLFDWLAAVAVRRAQGSPYRLFGLVYLVGTLVTVLLSNDATAVVLTPAVYAATRAAGASPLPYLFVCAFIANAASFVLPISNPANLVVFGAHMPDLAAWLRQFGLASLACIGMTYLALRLTQRHALAQEKLAAHVPMPQLERGGRLTACGLAATAIVLLGSSALGTALGLPTFICGVALAAIVLALRRRSPYPLITGISWSVLPLVAGLFVLVEMLDKTGVIGVLGERLRDLAAMAAFASMSVVASVVALACNLMNNLPVGLVVGSVVASDHLPPQITGAALIAVDVGPNLSVTGSLATILWLIALRREGIQVSALSFLRLGLVIAPPSLLAAILALALGPS